MQIQSIKKNGKRYYRYADIVKSMGYTSTFTPTWLRRKYKVMCLIVNKNRGRSKDEYYISGKEATKLCDRMSKSASQRVSELRRYLTEQDTA